MKEIIEYLYDDALGCTQDATSTISSRSDLRQAVQQLEERTGGDEYTQEDVMALLSGLFKQGGRSVGAAGDESGASSWSGVTSSAGSSGSVGGGGGGYTTTTSDTDAEMCGGSVLGAGDSLGALDSAMSEPGSGAADQFVGRADQEAHSNMTGARIDGASQEDAAALKKQFEARIVAMNAEYKSSTGGGADLQIEKCSECPFMYALQCLQKVGVPHSSNRVICNYQFTH